MINSVSNPIHFSTYDSEGMDTFLHGEVDIPFDLLDRITAVHSKGRSHAATWQEVEEALAGRYSKDTDSRIPELASDIIARAGVRFNFTYLSSGPRVLRSGKRVWATNMTRGEVFARCLASTLDPAVDLNRMVDKGTFYLSPDNITEGVVPLDMDIWEAPHRVAGIQDSATDLALEAASLLAPRQVDFMLLARKEGMGASAQVRVVEELSRRTDSRLNRLDDLSRQD